MNEHIFKHIGWLNKIATVLFFSTLVACGGGSNLDNSNSQDTNNSQDSNSGSVSNSSHSGPSTSGSSSSSGSSINVKLSWNPNPGSDVDGYAVNYGTSSDTVNISAASIPATLPNFNPAAPSIVFDVATKFGVVAGEQICFNVRAYNDAGFTTPSSSACITV